MGMDEVLCPNKEDIDQLEQIDEELCRHKVRWLLANDVSSLGYEMPFTDVLLEPSVAGRHDSSSSTSRVVSTPSGSNMNESSAKGVTGSDKRTKLDILPEVVSPQDMLPGNEQAAEVLHLRPFSQARVELVPGGEERIVTEMNK